MVYFTMKRMDKMTCFFNAVRLSMAIVLSAIVLCLPIETLASAAERKLSDLQSVLFEFEIDKMYRDSDKGYARIEYPRTSITRSSQLIAKADQGEYFRIVGVRANHFEIEFELKDDRLQNFVLWRGFVPKSHVYWRALSEESEIEFTRYLTRNRLQYNKSTQSYLIADLFEAARSINTGQALMREGEALIKSGETSTSLHSIADERFKTRRTAPLGQSKIREGERKIAEGEKMLKEGREAEQKALEKQEKVMKELTLDIGQAMQIEFADDNFLDVVEYGAMARLLGLDISTASEHLDLSKKAVFYLSEFEHEGDMAYLAKDYEEAAENYSNALTISEDNTRLKLKLGKAGKVIEESGIAEPKTPDKAPDDKTGPPPDDRSPELVDFKGNKVDADKLKRIQDGLEQVYEVDADMTKESITQLLQPDDAIESTINWELSITGYKTVTKSIGMYICDDVEFEYDKPLSGLKKGAKVKVVGKVVEIDNRKVGKKRRNVYIIDPDLVFFQDDPDYIYY
jgi:tetratricopeptide (TPR) repeat protein